MSNLKKNKKGEVVIEKLIKNVKAQRLASGDVNIVIPTGKLQLEAIKGVVPTELGNRTICFDKWDDGMYTVQVTVYVKEAKLREACYKVEQEALKAELEAHRQESAVMMQLFANPEFADIKKLLQERLAQGQAVATQPQSAKKPSKKATK